VERCQRRLSRGGHGAGERAFRRGDALLLTAAAGNTVWIGGTEDAASQGTWVWSPSGTPLSYKNWANGMPDNQGGMQDCLAFNYQLYYTNTGKWDDQHCASTQYYVCQIPL